MADSANSLHAWNTIIRCPKCCNDAFSIGNTTATNGVCNECFLHWKYKDNCLKWDKENNNEASASRWKFYFNKIINQRYPTSNVFLPFRYVTHMLVENYYKKTLYDFELARKWRDHYLQGLKLTSKDVVLDIGCGRGRFIALSNQLGFKTYGQDIKQNVWWHKIRKTNFQVVPAHYTNLPWKSDVFSLVMLFGVIHYIDDRSISNFIKEIHRILKPGGYCILLEANKQGYGSSIPLKQIGCLHSHEKISSSYLAHNFNILSLEYEGFYSPIAPLLVNFFRKLNPLKQFDISDYGTLLESKIPPEKRAFWLMKTQKQY